MHDDFKAALARVQSDYTFYVQCESDPGTALANYALSPEERLALSKPERLAEALRRGAVMLPSITIKISGSHDWVNRAAPQKKQVDELVAHEVEFIRTASDNEARNESTLRLIQLLG